jgi:hypothetical protein
MRFTGWFFRLLRCQRDVKAIERGRMPQRFWNRTVSKVLRNGARRLYR